MLEVVKVIPEKTFLFSENSVLNITVSAWPSYFDSNNPKEVNLVAWLTSDKYAQRVESIRRAKSKHERDKLKAVLPAITPSGLFTHREESGLIKHSGLIQIDIDFKGNEGIANYLGLKEELAKIRNMAFIGLSVSGKGFWGLVPIQYPEKHLAHFLALQQDLQRFGITIDSAPKNVASLRGYSWDSEAYFNPFAEPYTKLLEPKPEPYQAKYQSQRPGTTESEKVEAIIQQIESGRIDITPGYKEGWFAIGCALANEFGELGRDYFHRVSQYHPEYCIHATDKQFSLCIKGRYRYSIGTFYSIAEQYGIHYKGSIQKEFIPYTQPKKEGLPEGFRVLRGNILEVHGLPWQMLSEAEQEEARAQMKGYETGIKLLESFE